MEDLKRIPRLYSWETCYLKMIKNHFLTAYRSQKDAELDGTCDWYDGFHVGRQLGLIEGCIKTANKLRLEQPLTFTLYFGDIDVPHVYYRCTKDAKDEREAWKRFNKTLFLCIRCHL